MAKHPDGPHMVIEKKEFDIPCKYFCDGKCQKNLNGYCDWKNAKYDCQYGPHYTRYTYAEKKDYFAKKKNRNKPKSIPLVTQDIYSTPKPKLRVGALVKTSKYGVREVYKLHKKSFDIIIPEENNRLIQIMNSNLDYKIIEKTEENLSPEIFYPGNSVMINGKGKCRITAIDGGIIYYEVCATGVRGSVLRYAVSPVKKAAPQPKTNKTSKPILSVNPTLPEEILENITNDDIVYKKFNEVQINSGDVLIFDKEGYTISQVKNNEIFFTRHTSIKANEYLFGFISKLSFKSYYICKLKNEK